MTEEVGTVKYGWSVKLAVIALILVQMTQGLCNPSLAGIMALFPNEDVAAIQTILNIPMLIMIFSALVTGSLAHKIGYKTTGIIAMLLALIGGVAPGLVHPSVGVMIFERAIFGIGYGMVYALAIAAAGEFWRGKEITKMVGIITFACGLVGLVYNAFAGVLVTMGWECIYYAYGIIIIFMIYYAIAMPQRSELPVPKNADAKEKGGLAGLGAKYWEFFIAMTVALCCLNVFMSNIAMVVVGTGIDATGAAVAVVMMGFTAGLMIGGAIYPPMYRVLKRLTMAVFILVDAVCFTLVVTCTNSTSLVLLIVLAIIIGIVFGGVNAEWGDMANKKVQDYPRASALGSSLFIAGAGIGQFMTPFVMGPLAGIFGQTQANPFYQYYPAIAILAVGGIVLLVMAIIKKNKVDYEHEEESVAAEEE